MTADELVDALKVACALRELKLCKYVAMDSNGVWYTYADKPSTWDGGTAWGGYGECRVLGRLVNVDCGRPWDKSLVDMEEHRYVEGQSD